MRHRRRQQLVELVLQLYLAVPYYLSQVFDDQEICSSILEVKQDSFELYDIGVHSRVLDSPLRIFSPLARVTSFPKQVLLRRRDLRG
jgi:hypothetical protein